MKVKVLFFANFKELLQCGELALELADDASVVTLCSLLAQRGPSWLEIFANPTSRVKVSINQEMAELTSALNDGDEVGFFPPVTGG